MTSARPLDAPPSQLPAATSGTPGGSHRCGCVGHLSMWRQRCLMPAVHGQPRQRHEHRNAEGKAVRQLRRHTIVHAAERGQGAAWWGVAAGRQKAAAAAH
eukprot:scaffold27886_cov59-Phaeocystis_antarctica.AAC.5